MTFSSRQHLVESRLTTWLSGDSSGIRRAALSLFLQHEELTIEDVYERLAPFYQISYHRIGGMIGLISSRIGILQGVRDEKRRCRRYRLREKDLPSVKRILRAS